jgi:hypothetical protein
MDAKEQPKKVSDIVVTDQSSALNVLVGFVSLGQQRGVFSIEESAKIWECISFFQNKSS